MTTPLRERPDAPLGTLIFRAGLLPAETIESALEEGVRTGRRLGEILIERGLLKEEDLTKLLASQKGLPFVSIREHAVDPEAARLLGEEQAKLFCALPIGIENGTPVVAVADPTNDVLVRNVSEALGRPARFVVAVRSELAETIQNVFNGNGHHPEVGPAPEPMLEVEPVTAPEPVPVAQVEAVPEPVAQVVPAVEPVSPELALVDRAIDPAQAAAPFPVYEAEEQAPAAPSIPDGPDLPPVQAPDPAPETNGHHPAFVQNGHAETPVVVTPAPAPLPAPVVAAPAPPVAAPPAPVEPAPAPPPIAPVPPPPVAPAPPVTPAPADPPLTPTAAVSEQPEPAADAPGALTVRVAIRLSNGERVPVADFGAVADAKEHARSFIRQLSEQDDDWPFVNGRFLRPETIISIDLEQV